MESDFEFILNFEKLESEIEDDLVIYGRVSSSNEDYDGEIVDQESLKMAWDEYSKNPIIRFLHNKDPKHQGAIGKMLPEYTDKNGKVYKSGFNENGDPYIVAMISRSDDVKDIRTKIREGIYKGFSVGGRAKKIKIFDSTLQKETIRLFVKRLAEVSVVDAPASGTAMFEVLKMACVGENCPLITIDNEKENEDIMEEEEKNIDKKEGNGKEKPSKIWMDNCLSTMKGATGVDDPGALCGWLWYHGKEKGFGTQKEAIGKEESTSENEPTEAIQKDIKSTKGGTIMDEKEEEVIKMDIPELVTFVKQTVVEMIEEQELLEKSEDYERLLTEYKDLRTKIEGLEAKNKELVGQLKTQEAMKSEDDGDVKKEEAESVVDERDVKMAKLEEKIKEIENSPLYKNVSDKTEDGDVNKTETSSHIGNILKAHYGGE